MQETHTVICVSLHSFPPYDLLAVHYSGEEMYLEGQNIRLCSVFHVKWTQNCHIGKILIIMFESVLTSVLTCILNCNPRCVAKDKVA
jgi:hypothetical protein